MPENEAIIAAARAKFHRSLVTSFVLSVSAEGIPSNADKGNKPSIEIARRIAASLGAATHAKLPAQTSGTSFEGIVCEFIKDTFPQLQHLRPGKWDVFNLGNKSDLSTSHFAQYAHLAYLAELMDRERQLSTVLGNDYFVAPDIVIARQLCTDAEINSPAAFIDACVSTKADLRKANGGLPLLHASVSAKWTMRSDRAQNSRTEALNLIRNRKGHLPHIVVVTGEPLPSRLASLALGTGDIDCVYHFALPELLAAVHDYAADGREDLVEQVENLVQGKRLKDISDLPLDLAC
jgi:hypothetical protein